MTDVSAAGVPTLLEAFADEKQALLLIAMLRAEHGLVGADMTRANIVESFECVPDMEEVNELGERFTTSIVNQVIREARTTYEVRDSVESAVETIIDDLAQAIRADNEEVFTLAFQSGSGTIEIAPWRNVADAVAFADDHRGMTLQEILGVSSNLNPEFLEERAMLITSADGDLSTKALSYYVRINRDGDDTVLVLAPNEITHRRSWA